MNDHRLRHAFDELRRHESAHAPQFDHLWRSRPARRTMVPAVSAAFALLILITATFVALRHAQRSPAPPISTWRAPTDFLLNTPGRELIHSVPDLKGNLQ